MRVIAAVEDVDRVTPGKGERMGNSSLSSGAKRILIAA